MLPFASLCWEGLSFSCLSASLGQISSSTCEWNDQNIQIFTEKPRGKLKIRGKIYIQVSRSGLCIQHSVWTWPSKATLSSSSVETHSYDVETRMRSYTTSEKETFKRNKLEPGLTHGQWVKNLPAMQETQVWSLGEADPLEEEMATHSSILAWETPWTEEPGGLQSKGSHRVGHD